MRLLPAKGPLTNGGDGVSMGQEAPGVLSEAAPIESTRVDVCHTLEPLLETIDPAPGSENVLTVQLSLPKGIGRD